MRNQLPQGLIALLSRMLSVFYHLATSYKTFLVLFVIFAQSVVLGTGENSIQLSLAERAITTTTGILFVFPIALLIFPIVVTLLFYVRLPIILWIPITVLITATLEYWSGVTYWFVDVSTYDLQGSALYKNAIIHQFFVFLVIHFLHRDLIISSLANVEPQDRRRPVLHQNADGPADKILNRLPQLKWGPVLEVSIDDRSTTVRTTRGNHVLRLPLKQAVKEIDVSKGLSVHRAFWLNEGEIEQLFFEEGNPRVRLIDGSIRPVSRSKTAEIREMLQSE